MIDTRLDTNSTGLRSPSEVESLIARMDMVVTTRLHGTVLAIKNGVPAIAIDPEAGGAKIRRQAETIGWPVVFTVDALTDEALQEAFDYCMTEDARAKTRESCDRAMKMVQETRDEFISALASATAVTNYNWSPQRRGTDQLYLERESDASSGNLVGKKVLGDGKELLKRISRRTLPGAIRRWLRTRW